MKQFFSLVALLMSATTLCAQGGAGTTILTMNAGGGLGSLLPQDYGDNVSAAMGPGGYSYGGVPNFTPDIVVDHEVLTGGIPGPSVLRIWAGGYGSLGWVAYPTGGEIASFTLTAAPGFTVELESLNFGGYAFAPFDVPEIRVIDGAGALRWFQANVSTGSSTSFTTLVFTDVAASVLRIEFDMLGMAHAPDNLGITDIKFRQRLSGLGWGGSNGADASLQINSVGVSGQSGPFQVSIPSSGVIDLDWAGPPNQPLLLVASDSLAASSIVVACVGSIDINILSPDFALLFDGTRAGFPDALFRLTGNGISRQTFTVPGTGGVSFSLQGAVLQLPSAPCPIKLTAAFEITLL